jgi:UDP-N-acetylglucosamine 2-epimerase (non-hydrolysing)
MVGTKDYIMFTALLVLGTRPEVIKLAPVYRELSKRTSRFRVVTCVTGQHRELLDQMLQVFNIKPDIDLNVIKQDQTLYHLTTSVLTQMEKVLVDVKPHVTIVQGDTSSAFTAALGSFYANIPVAHVEAGLRSYDKFQPFPEEINRILISHIADLNFCPTQAAAENLKKENILHSSIFVTGNTVIDALLYTVSKLGRSGNLDKQLDDLEIPTKRMILVTAPSYSSRK